jgi:predicted AAA+ superfamily ATPase
MTQGVRGGSRERPSCRPRHHFDGKFGVDVSTPPADAGLVVLSLRSPGNGKSTWIRSRFEDAFIVNLLAAEVMLRHERDPAGFRAEVLAVPRNRWIVIDEVQRVPRLLDEVHFLMEEKGYKKFALTGSSARKLKRGAANLLAGRAIVRNLFPLTAAEMDFAVPVSQLLHFGGMPLSVNAPNDEAREDFLRAYVTTYLAEEIRPSR